MAIEDCCSRRWLITQSDPDDHGVSQGYLSKKLISSESFLYLCSSREIGESGTPHIHCYVEFSTAFEMSTLKCWFPYAHFDIARGDFFDNRNYVFKQGKYSNTTEVNVEESHEELNKFDSGRVALASKINISILPQVLTATQHIKVLLIIVCGLLGILIGVNIF